MFKKLFGQGGGHGGGGGGGGGGGTSHQGSRQVTATSTQKTVDAIQKLGEVGITLSGLHITGCSRLGALLMRYVLSLSECMLVLVDRGAA